MFFIGVFGINQKREELGTYNNVVCPSCGSYTRLAISKSYSYFHIFFVPTFRWNQRYFARSCCCGALFELDGDIGRAFENGENPKIEDSHMHLLSAKGHYSLCPDCGARLEDSHVYCPYCGRRL